MENKTIYLIPIGEVEKGLLDYLSGQIEKIIPYSVKMGESISKPDYAYNRERDQYKSDLILRNLQKLNLPGDKILGIVDLDLYTSGLNFIFGQAVVGGKVALIALPRLRQEFYGLTEDKRLYYTRVLKEAIHELGHTFGLTHCKDIRCVMHFSNSLANTDYKREKFCKKCLKKLPFDRKNHFYS